MFLLVKVKWEVTNQQIAECKNKGKDPEVSQFKLK